MNGGDRSPATKYTIDSSDTRNRSSKDTPNMHELGKDPLTWSFVKLLGVHVSRDLVEFGGLPASHAWRFKMSGLWRARLLTKAQCIGVVISTVERADRGET
uniref:Uncharacterized protein n=1 Tax=Peronospora matthiolae TaxID=2874970 RepID=A0AAV1VD19_9STRA